MSGGNEFPSLSKRLAITLLAIFLGTQIPFVLDDFLRPARAQLPLQIPSVPEVAAFSNEELFCVTRTILGEAGNESDYGKHLVAMVIVNRAMLRGGEADLCKVISEPGQFAGKDAVVTLSSKRQFDYFMSSYNIAKDTLRDYPYYPAQERELLYFHSGSMPIDWHRHYRFALKEGGHTFYSAPIDFE